MEKKKATKVTRIISTIVGGAAALYGIYKLADEFFAYKYNKEYGQDYDNGRDVGHDEGYDNGFEDGYLKGKSEGYDFGLKKGKEDAYMNMEEESHREYDDSPKYCTCHTNCKKHAVAEEQSVEPVDTAKETTDADSETAEDPSTTPETQQIRSRKDIDI